MNTHPFAMELAHGRQRELLRQAEASRRAAQFVQAVRHRRRRASARTRPAPRTA